MVGFLILGLIGCAPEEVPPPLEGVELVFWEDQNWESGGGTDRLTIWADGRNRVEVYPGPPYLYPGKELRARSGWEKVTSEVGTTFVRADVFPAEIARNMFREAVQAGITLLKSEQAEYADGGGVLVGAKVGGVLHQATIPTFNERLAQETRFKAVGQVLQNFPKQLDAFEVIE
jgi:hypothetical protein